MRDKVVFVTGSSKGIGKALAVELARQGAKVAINARSKDALESALAEVNAVSQGNIALVGDVSDPEQCRQMVAEIVQAFGRIDVLVNNAAIAARGLFREMSPSSWKTVIDINTMGSIYITKAAMPELVKSKGSVIFISSIGGRAGLPGHGAYSVSKMPMASLAETIAIEYENEGIHSGLVYIGFTENEPDKQIMDGDGNYRTISSRPALLIQKREKVVRSVIRVIKKRKRKVVLSAAGKMQSIVYLIAPLRRFILRKMLRSYKGMYDE